MMGGVKIILKNIWKVLRGIRAWQWLLILIPMLFLTATALRMDHLKMVELKEAVSAADERLTGESGGAETDRNEGGENAEGGGGEDSDSFEVKRGEIFARLGELREFVAGHMVVNIIDDNGVQKVTFGTGPVYLEHLYQVEANAAVEKAQEELAISGNENPNGNVFAKAMEVCKPIAIQNGWSWNSRGYLDCMTGEINKYPTAESLTLQLSAAVPSTALYRYDFSAPAWTFGLPGLLVLADVVILGVAVVKIIYWVFLRLALLIIK